MYDISNSLFSVAQHSIVAASASHAWATLEGSVNGGTSTLSANTAVAAALQQVGLLSLQFPHQGRTCSLSLLHPESFWPVH